MRNVLVRHRPIPFAVLLAAVAACGTTVDEDLPPFVAQLIEQYEAGPKSNPPGSIWRYHYKGLVVFYVPPSCCDVPSELYGSDGHVICSPDGGITGAGDGKCPDFFEQRTDGLRVWSDARQ